MSNKEAHQLIFTVDEMSDVGINLGGLETDIHGYDDMGNEDGSYMSDAGTSNWDNQSSSTEHENEIDSDASDDDKDAPAGPTQKNLNDVNSKKGFRWTQDRCAPAKMLIHLRTNADHKFEQPRSKKSKIWNSVAKKMQENGFNVNGASCSKKWDNLMRYYKAKKNNDKKTGRGRIDWALYNLMDKAMGEKACVEPDPQLLSASIRDTEEEFDPQAKTKDGSPPIKKQKRNPVPEWFRTWKDEKSGEEANQWEKFQKMEQEKLAKYEQLENARLEKLVEIEQKKLQQLSNIEERKVDLLEKILAKLS